MLLLLKRPVKNRQCPSDEHAYRIKGDISEFEKIFKEFE
jgi:hypothetical protein